MLKPKIMNGLEILGRDAISNDIETTISDEVVGGEVYIAGGAGSVSEAWDTQVKSNGELGSVSVEFDPNMLEYGGARHVGFYSGEQINDMMSLLDKGGVGSLFGPENPAMKHEGMWGRIVKVWEKGMRRKIISAIREGGLHIW